MKKSLIALLLALVLTLGGAVYTAAGVADGIDDVVYRQTTVAGDPAAAEGITIRHKVQYDNFLHWDNVLTLGEGQHSLETDFHYTGDRVYEVQTYSPNGVTMWKGTGADYDTDVPLEQHEGFDYIMRKLYDDTAINETATVRMKLSEVYDYYPLGVEVDLMNHFFFSDVWANRYEQDSSVEAWTYVNDGFQEFFRIPVSTEEEYELTIEKRSDGMASSFGITEESYEKDRYDMTSFAASTATETWFTFTTHTTKGNVVDTSLIPGGYGIYHLSATEVENPAAPCDGILVDELECIYPMDPNLEVKALHLTGDGTRLMVCYADESRTLWVDVVSVSDGALLQTIELCTVPGDFTIYVEADQQQGMVLYEAEGRFILLEETDTGVELKLCVVGNRYENFPGQLFGMNFGWDGERLALVGGYGGTWWWGADVALSVYTADGLQYAGFYAGTLNNRYGNYQNYAVDGYPKIQSMQ